MKRILVVAIFLSLTVPALAGEVLQIVSSDRAERSLLSLELHAGKGTNLDWSKTDEIVESIFIDDPSFIGASTDGCITGISNRNCSKNSAKLIHLKLNLDLDLPVPKSDTSLITIVTEDEEKRRHIYLFDVKKAKKGDRRISLIQFVEASNSRLISTKNSILAFQLRRGLIAAIAQKAIDRPLLERCQNLIYEVEQGADLTIAAERAGLSRKFTEKLLELGQ